MPTPMCAAVSWKKSGWMVISQIVKQCEKSNALCSRNFQNVKLRLDFVEIWSFYRHSDFTWNHILGNSNSPKMLILTISEVLNFDFSQFEQIFKSQIYQNSKLRVSETVKMAIYESQIWSKLISRKIKMWIITSHFERFWSIVNWASYL